MLKEVTATISRLKEQCAFGMKLYKLLSELITICAELCDIPISENSHQNCRSDDDQATPWRTPHILTPSTRENVDTAPASQHSLLTPTQEDVSPVRDTTYPSSWSPGQGSDLSGATRPSIWDDELMRELFNIQPSVEWIDSEYMDSLNSPRS